MQNHLTPTVLPKKEIKHLSINIPEPTGSLVWITDADPVNIISPFQYTIRISVSAERTDFEFLKNKGCFFAEPSLLWTHLPVKKHNEHQYFKTCYPSYPELTPEQRWTYLNWLTDITKDISVTYKFLYLYGLERQLLIGNFDLAVEELIRLYETDKTKELNFKDYIIDSLILASGMKNRPNIITKAPFLLKSINNLSLTLRVQAGKDLELEDFKEIIDHQYFGNKYTKNLFERNKDIFCDELEKEIKKFKSIHRCFLCSVNLKKIKDISHEKLLNPSIPSEISYKPCPYVMADKNLKSSIGFVISQSFYNTKNRVGKKELYEDSR